MVVFQRFTRDKLGDNYDVNGTRLRRKGEIRKGWANIENAV